MKVSTIKPVGPSRATASRSRPASARLTLDSHLMPRSTPLALEAMYSTKHAAITASCMPRPPGSPNTRVMPALICIVPKPRVVATPIAVATTATMLTTLPIHPRWRSPISGCSRSLTRPRPLRLYWNHAIASPISA